MAGSVNKVILIGNVGADPEIKTMQSGDRVCNLTVATSESWKDKSTGEKKERTEWHRVVVFNQGLMNVCENYIRKGSKIYLEGQLETRSWEQNGEKKYSTEVVLRPYRGEITLLDSKKSDADVPHEQNKYNDPHPNKSQGGGYDADSDQIPFSAVQHCPM